ncbi:MAG: Cof-type HAD-IIB family hydrolase [Oscillospiraceae bacterium]|jgi:Cof subfamily protein (haloacid dehalogenase superfamily)|nr:Cof-type HAD-IIB family hydrolase [Oscillospiraceae bacterium]
MIATDLDGTLLRDDKTVSKRTEDVLRHCRDAGIKVVFATGRSGSATRLVPDGLFDGYAVNNGAAAMDGGEMIYKRFVPYETARPLLTACDRHGLKAGTQLDGWHYTNFDISEVWPHITEYKMVDFSTHELDGEKLYIEDCGSEETTFVEARLPQDLYLTVSRDKLGQVMHKDATKSKAVAELARHWGIAREEIVAFGDDLNDLDMLSYAGTGVAMGNALDKVKTAADDICLSNEEDGLADWLLKKLASVVGAEKKGVLICEQRDAVAGAVLSTVKSLNVRCKLVTAETGLYTEMKSGDWSHIFAAPSLFDNLQILAPRLNPETKLVLLASPGELGSHHALSAITVPVNPISVANVLNGTLIGTQKPVPAEPDGQEKIMAIEGLDVQKGLAVMGGSVEKYKYILSVFVQDAFEKAGKLKASLDGEDLTLYATHAHALKSAAGYIGAGELSEAADGLERAGKRQDMAFIEGHNAAFIEALEEMLGRISKAVK